MNREQLEHDIQATTQHLREWVEQMNIPLTPDGIRALFLILCLRPEVASALLDHQDPWMQKAGQLYFSTEPQT